MALKKISFDEVTKGLTLYDSKGVNLGVVDELFPTHIGMYIRNGFYCIFKDKFDAYVKFEKIEGTKVTLPAASPLTNNCKGCKYFNRLNSDSKHGVCLNVDVLVAEGDSGIELHNSKLDVGMIVVGQNFGCIHFKK
jgi:hypothetical protein